MSSRRSLASSGPALHEASVPLVRRPMMPTSRIAIFEREVREKLSRAALDALLARAEVLSEGQPSGGGGKMVFVGSTMLTLDLGRGAGLFREVCDVGTAHKLAAMLARDTAARTRIRAIATREAERIATRKVRELTAEIRVSTRGVRVLVDVDVEAVL